LNRKPPRRAGCVVLAAIALPIAILSVRAAEPAPARYVDEMPMTLKQRLAEPFHTEQSEAVEPFTILGNVHYVGAKNIASYLITTEAGHILLDSGVREMEQAILENIAKLGFEVRDVQILLSSHAHFDHIQGHEALRKATGARVHAMVGDAEALRAGKDLSPLGFEGWPPVQVDRVLRDGDEVSLGGTVMTAHRIPGHTPGCTVWTMPVVDRDATFSLAFHGCNGPNRGVRLIGNENFPSLVEDARAGFERLRALRPDLYLTGHPAELFAGRMQAMRDGVRPHPLTTQQPWLELVAELENRFSEQLASQRASTPAD